MDLGSIFLILALAILVGLYITRPFSWQKKQPAKVLPKNPQEATSYSVLLAERERIITALQELDFDYLLGKIPEEEYPAQRTQLLQQGAEILRRIDLEQKAQEEQLLAEERREAVFAERRQAHLAASGNGNNRPPDDPLEALIAKRRRSRQEKATGFCHKCGGPLQKSDRFCPKCGVSVGQKL